MIWHFATNTLFIQSGKSPVLWNPTLVRSFIVSKQFDFYLIICYFPLMEHLYIFITILVLGVGGASLTYTINLYKKQRLLYLKIHNYAIAIFNFQILCGLIFDYYAFNISSNLNNQSIPLIVKLYIIQLSLVIVILTYSIILIFYLLSKEEWKNNWRKVFLSFFHY